MTHLSSSRFDLAALLARDEPPRPSQRTPEAVRFTEEEQRERKKLDTIKGAADAAGCERMKASGSTPVAPTTTPSPEAAPASGGKFKPGDRVKAVRRFNGWYSPGDTGVVLLAEMDCLMVRFDPSPTTCRDLIEPGTCCEFESDLELLPPKEGEGLVDGKVYLTKCAELGTVFARWIGHWTNSRFMAENAARLNCRSSYQDRTVIREATPAELKGEQP